MTLIAGVFFLSLVSVITFSVKPVCSSTSSRYVIPSSMLTKTTVPFTSEIIRALYGSHLQITSPFLSFVLLLTNNSEPYGILVFIITIPVFSSVILSSADRPTTITLVFPSSPFFSIVLNSSISNKPFPFALMSETSAMFEAVPPTWNVLSVS